MSKKATLVFVPAILLLAILAVLYALDNRHANYTYTCGYTLTDEQCEIAKISASAWNNITPKVSFEYVVEEPDITVNAYSGTNPTIAGSYEEESQNLIVYDTDKKSNEEIQGVITHEFGHAIGLDHNEDVDPAIDSVMTYGSDAYEVTEFDKQEVMQMYEPLNFRKNQKAAETSETTASETLENGEVTYCTVTVMDELSEENSTALVDHENGVMYDSYSKRQVEVLNPNGCDLEVDYVYESSAIVNGDLYAANGKALEQGKSYYLELVYSEDLEGYIVSISHSAMVCLEEYLNDNNPQLQINYFIQVFLQYPELYSELLVTNIQTAVLIDSYDDTLLTEKYSLVVDGITTDIIYHYDGSIETFKVNGMYFQTTAPVFSIIEGGVYDSSDLVDATDSHQSYWLYVQVTDNLNSSNSVIKQEDSGIKTYYSKREVVILDQADWYNMGVVYPDTYVYEISAVDEYGTHTPTLQYEPLEKGEQYYIYVEYSSVLDGYVIKDYVECSQKLSDYKNNEVEEFTDNQIMFFLQATFFMEASSYPLDAINNMYSMTTSENTTTPANVYTTTINGVAYEIYYEYDEATGLEYIEYLGRHYQTTGQCFTLIANN